MAGLAGMTENYTEPVSLHLGVSFAVLYRRCTSINMCSHVSACRRQRARAETNMLAHLVRTVQHYFILRCQMCSPMSL
jgi:hypothetical protein